MALSSREDEPCHEIYLPISSNQCISRSYKYASNPLPFICHIKEIISEGYYIKPLAERVGVCEILYCEFFNETQCLHMKFWCLLDTPSTMFLVKSSLLFSDKNRQETGLAYLDSVPKATIMQAARSNEAQTAASVNHKEGNRHFPTCHQLFRFAVYVLAHWLFGWLFCWSSIYKNKANSPCQVLGSTY